MREALANQLQPGVAANQDSVAKLTDAMIELKSAEAQLSRDEIKEQSKYLNPVQRAQLYVMRERFAHRVKEVHGHRGEMRGWHRDETVRLGAAIVSGPGRLARSERSGEYVNDEYGEREDYPAHRVRTVVLPLPPK